MSVTHRMFNKIVLCITEDWFVVSHFLPLVRVLSQISREVVVVTRCSAHREKIEYSNVRVVDFDFERFRINPIANLKCAWRLAQILRRENPDVAHFLAMKPIVLGTVASRFVRSRRSVVHVTGLGYLATSRNFTDRVLRRLTLYLIARHAAHPSAWVVVENPDDFTYLKDQGVRPINEPVITNGAGIDPAEFVLLSKRDDTDSTRPTVVMACRMLHAKGIEDVVTAYKILADRKIPVRLKLFGGTDFGNHDAIQADQLKLWTEDPYITWHGHVDEVSEIWAKADIAVVASRDREGLPRSLLEAAAAVCALVVTDIPGCRHVVEHDVHGLVVPPRNPEAIASAIARLAQDPKLRKKLGSNAHRRVCTEFSVDQVNFVLQRLYGKIEQNIRTTSSTS